MVVTRGSILVGAGFAAFAHAKPQFAKGVGCSNGYSGCCNTCPDGYSVILDLNACAAAAQVVRPWQEQGCYKSWSQSDERMAWKDVVKEIESKRPLPFGCSLYQGSQHGCGLNVNTYNLPDTSDCGSSFDTSVLCELDKKPRLTQAVCTALDNDPHGAAAHVSCCDGLQEVRGYWDYDYDLTYKCRPAGSYSAVCTALNKDPYAARVYVPCCEGLYEVRGSWDNDEHLTYKCRPANTLGGSVVV